MIKNAILSDTEASVTRKQNTTDTNITVSLTRIQISKQPKVTSFMNVMGRNSLKTKKIYETGLVHFKDFLNDKYNGMHSLETIVEAISKNQVDPYALIDDFISLENSNTRVVRVKK